MSAHRTLLAASALLFLGPALVFGLPPEIDFRLDSGTQVDVAEPLRATQTTGLSASIDWEIAPNVELLGTGGAALALSGEQDELGEGFSGDIDMLRFQIERPNLFGGRGVGRFRAGRLMIAEPTGSVLVARVDGIGLEYQGPSLVLAFDGGYTGLQLASGASLIETPTEQTRDTRFAPGRWLAGLSIGFPEVLARQSPSFYALANLEAPDLAPTGAGLSFASAGETWQSVYFGGGITGPLSRRLFYSAYGFYQGGAYSGTSADTDYSSSAFLGAADIRLYVEELAYSFAQLGGVFSTGQDGQSLQIGDAGRDRSGLFTPVTRSLPAAFAPFTNSNIGALVASYSFRPFAGPEAGRTGFRIEPSFALAFRPSEGAGTIDGLAPSTPAGYAGFGSALLLEYRPFRDLGVELSLRYANPSDLVRNSPESSISEPVWSIFLNAFIAF